MLLSVSFDTVVPISLAAQGGTLPCLSPCKTLARCLAWHIELRHHSEKRSSQSHAVDELSESPGVAGKLLLQPLTTAPEFRVVDMESAGRRRLAPFQLCLACKCCVSAADPNTCATMPCCFGIDCQLPNKPFGVCAFVPKTCNCTSCAV
nr:kinase APK1B, chloroplast precursor [Ipomoea batatas]